MKVRATQDGHYGGYYRIGPITSDQGVTPGEVFEIDEKPFQLQDGDGRPVFEVDEDGKPRKDKHGNSVPKMGSWFTESWMERMPDNTPVTFNYSEAEIPKPYRQPSAPPSFPQAAASTPRSLKEIAGVI